MQRHDIANLQAVQGYPALTITLPTYRAAPDTQQNPIRLKNLMQQARTQLESKGDSQSTERLMAQLTTLVDEFATRDYQDGLALFVHKDFARAYPVPFSLPERVVVDTTFVTRDLVRAHLQQTRYWVLTLGDHSRLFAGVNGTLTEQESSYFPVVFVDEYEVPSTPGARESKHESFLDEQQRQFLRRVDDALTEALRTDELPVVVAGVTRNLAFFHEITANAKCIAGTVEGNYERVGYDEIARVAWAALEPYLQRRQAATLKSWGDSIGAGLVARGITEVWEAAFDGRGDLLLVEEDYHAAGRVDDSGRTLTLAEEGDEGDATMRYDAVDDLIELVLSRGGRVQFVGTDVLPADAHVGLTLRY